MRQHRITSLEIRDVRFPLKHGAGSDAVHSGAEYAFATTLLDCDRELYGTGIVLTLGQGNELVCQAIEFLGKELVGREIEELMAEFGVIAQRLAQHPQLRWLGPHKGVVHLALASITNACFDFWAKSRGKPLWKLLLDLAPDEVVRLLDLSYLDEVLSERDAVELLQGQLASRNTRMSILNTGYPGYDTSVGWMGYDDQKVRDLTRRAMDSGFKAFKLKVGSDDQDRDLRRAAMLRECIGDSGALMFDANQRWSLPVAIRMSRELALYKPTWIEEPTHPDDIHGHALLAREIAPIKIAAGEHIPNRVVFKNFFQASAIHYVQADCTRLAGVSEFLTVSLLATKFGLPVVPHVGDMGQLHQHLVLFNHIGLGQEPLFLEHISHLRDHFVFPATVADGRYKTPQQPGASCDLKLSFAGNH